MKLPTPNFLLVASILGVLALTGCTVTVQPDGSKSATVNGEQVIRALEIYATK